MKHPSVLIPQTFCLVFSGMAFSQNINTPENFPDPSFRAAVEEFMGVAPGGEFTAAQAAAKTGTFNCGDRKITSARGLRFFTGVTGLVCYDKQSTSLDVSKNTALHSLDCSDNQLTNISSLAANPRLEAVVVTNNNLDCGDWDDVAVLKARLGDPVPGYVFLLSGFAYSPQNGLDPYDCTPVLQWYVH